MEARKMHTSTGTRTVEHMFNETCRELGLTKEDLFRKARDWYFKGKCTTDRFFKNAMKKFNKLHKFPEFVVDYLNNRYRTKPA